MSGTLAVVDLSISSLAISLYSYTIYIYSSVYRYCIFQLNVKKKDSHEFFVRKGFRLPPPGLRREDDTWILAEKPNPSQYLIFPPGWIT